MTTTTTVKATTPCTIKAIGLITVRGEHTGDMAIKCVVSKNQPGKGT